MINLTANSTPLDVSHVLQVLTLVTDPEASKQRLTELQDIITRANLGVERAEKLQAEVDQRLKVAAAVQASLEADKAAFGKVLKDTDARHTAMHAHLTQAEAALAARTDAHEQTMAAREADVSRREADATARETAINRRETDLATKEADIARRLKLMQQAAA